MRSETLGRTYWSVVYKLRELRKMASFERDHFHKPINEEVVELLVVVGWLALPLCLSIIE